LGVIFPTSMSPGPTSAPTLITPNSSNPAGSPHRHWDIFGYLLLAELRFARLDLVLFNMDRGEFICLTSLSLIMLASSKFISPPVITRTVRFDRGKLTILSSSSFRNDLSGLDFFSPFDNRSLVDTGPLVGAVKLGRA
jgi:hypothetical protein